MSTPDVTKRSDGSDGGPLLVPAGPNSALREPPPQPGDGLDLRHPARATDVTIVDADAGHVTGTRKKIAICGFASSSRDQIPVDNPEWEIWGMNQLYRHIKRADRWFDIHWNWHEETVPGTDYRGWLATCGLPIYMGERQGDLPTSVRFPIERLISRFGDYFTSTVAFMVALAIDEIDQRVMAQLFTEQLEDPPHVILRLRALYAEYTLGLFGIDLVVGEEYFWQKPCAEFWLGAASIGRGMRVYLPHASALCKQLYRYGYEKEPAGLMKSTEVAAHARGLLKTRDELLRDLYLTDGALQADEYWQHRLELRERGAQA